MTRLWVDHFERLLTGFLAVAILLVGAAFLMDRGQPPLVVPNPWLLMPCAVLAIPVYYLRKKVVGYLRKAKERDLSDRV